MGITTQRILRRERMEITINALIEMFAATKQTEGKSARTINWYSDMLSRCARYLGQAATLRDFSIDSARAFIAHLQSRESRYDDHPFREQVEGGLSANTVHGYVRALKAFSTWLNEEGYTKANVLTRLRRPKLPQVMIQTLSDSEIIALFHQINPNTYLGARQFVMLALLLDSGMRAGELINIRLSDIDLEGCQIKVMGKGRKERLVPFSSTTKRYLLRYLATFRNKDPDNPPTDEHLLLASDGTPLTYEGLSHSIKRMGINAGIPRLHAHLLRHTFAVNYLMNGGDIMSLKRILGHTTLDVTQVYMHLAEAHIKVQHSRFSPLDKLASAIGRRPRAA